MGTLSSFLTGYVIILFLWPDHPSPLSRIEIRGSTESSFILITGPSRSACPFLRPGCLRWGRGGPDFSPPPSLVLFFLRHQPPAFQRLFFFREKSAARNTFFSPRSSSPFPRYLPLWFRKLGKSLAFRLPLTNSLSFPGKCEKPPFTSDYFFFDPPQQPKS